MDDDGAAAQVDGHKSKLGPAKLLLEVKKDLLTSVVTLARNVGVHRPEVLVGFGQGGVVAQAYGHPLAMETALQARNVQVSELTGIAEAWAGVSDCSEQPTVE